ncbi:transcription factor E2F8 [Tiliqua scincoides]|uniref:transcription factor E2F8 n=1 Tax=Tiliqua scincoides TaxID=71010 RepID=UPI00346274B7
MNTEDKENQCFETHESTVQTPLKQTAASSWLLAEIQPAASDHLTTPPKRNEITPRDPWTPTANLKMLISAASPEIRNREQEKRLLDNRHEALEDHYSGDEYEKSQRSRKEKSLGLLCHKFLARYPCYPNASKNNEICLDEVAEELHVERRRIYDIMNVLESLHMVSRCAKNRYAWHGRHNLRKTLQLLKKVAEENKYTQQIELIKKRDYEGEPEGHSQKTKLVAKHSSPNDHEDICFVALPGMDFRAASVNGRKDKSLRVMSQKFVMLFLVSTPQVVNLEVAAKILISEDHAEYLDKSKFKTKIRRLYDIANVLSSLELIKKVHVTEERGRKPAFKWTGPDVYSDVQDTQPASAVTSAHPVEGAYSKEHCSKNLFPTRSKKGFTRHPSLKLGKDIQSDRRKIRSAPSSPIKKNTSQITSSFQNKMAQLAAICKQQLDEQSREFKKLKIELEYSTLPCSLESPSKSGLDVKRFVSPSCIEILPLIHNSASPAMLPPIHSNMPCTVYLNPPRTKIVTASNPRFTVQPVPCANRAGMKSPAAAVSNTAPVEILVEDKDSHLEEDSANPQDRKLRLPKEQDGTKNDLTSEKCFKRCKALLKGSPTKKCRGEDVELQNVLLGKFVKSEKRQSSTTLHLVQEILTPSVKEKEEWKYENAGQHLECQSEQQKQRELSDGDRCFTMQEMPTAFAEPMSKTWFPSGYLIPLAQCTKFNNETTLSNKENAEMRSAEQRISNSPVAGGTPVTSEFTAVNFPAFHITPLSLMLPLSSVATVPLVNGTAFVTPPHINPTQAPSSSNPSFTLQHLGLVPASMQMSVNPAVGSALICQGAEHVACAQKSLALKQGRALQPVFPGCGHELNRKFVSATCLQQTTGPVASKVFQESNENFFEMPGELSTNSGSCSSSAESDCADDVAFQGTLSVSQKKLDESTEDKS